VVAETGSQEELHSRKDWEEKRKAIEEGLL
jgi:hypothetical protein